MSNLVLEYVRPQLPWDPQPGESNRLRALMVVFLILALLIMIIVPRVKIPEVDRAKAEAVPENLAKVVLQRKEVPPPPPVPVKQEVIKKEELPQVKEEAPAAKPVEDAAPKPVVTDLQRSAAKARASAAIQDAGIADALAGIRDMDVGGDGTPTGMPGQAGSGTGGLITSTQEAGTSRNLITSRAGTGSGSSAGAYAGNMSSGYGGGKAGGKGTAGLLGAGGAGGAGAKLQTVQTSIAAGAAAGATDVVGKDGKSKRTKAEITSTFDRYLGRIYLLYQRALRDDPNLQGVVTVKLTIQPEGNVSDASVVSSQLSNPELEAKVLTIVKTMSFGAAKVDVWTGTHDLKFFSQ